MIVTFYSFKGGVGRSMALANIARHFQARGLNVVIVDWDLEAPGLETFFSSDPNLLKSWKDRVGLLDLLLLYRQDHAAIPFPREIKATDTITAPRSESESGGAAESLDDVDVSPPADSTHRPASAERWTTVEKDAARLRDLLPPLKFSLLDLPSPPPSSGSTPPGRLQMLTAGWREGSRFAAYANAVQAFDWNDFYASYHGHAYFEWLRSSLDNPAVADIVLVDSRTGVTEMGGVSTRQLADVVVVLMAPNRQNIEGSVQMTHSFARPELIEERGGRRIRVVMVPSRVDVAETEVKKAFEDDFKAVGAQFMPKALELLEADFWSLRIPYVSKFAFRERLSASEPDGDPDLNAAYTCIASYVAWLAPDSSRVKSAMVDDFERVFGRERVRGALDYAAQFKQRLSELPAELQLAGRELVLRLVDVRARTSTTERDRARVVLEAQLQPDFSDAIAAAERARLIVKTADAEGRPAIQLSQSEYVTKSELARWIEEDRDFLAWRQRLRFFMEDWRNKARDRGSLLQGSALVEAAEMASDARPNELLADEREFIEASKNAAREPVQASPVSSTGSHATDSSAVLSPSRPPPMLGKTMAHVPRPMGPSRSRVAAWLGAVAALVVIGAVGVYAAKQFSSGANANNVVRDSLFAGRQHFSDSNYTAAIAAYTYVLGVDSTSVEARRLRAEAQAAAGRPDSALADLDIALARAPNDAGLRVQRARVRADRGNTAGAIEDLARVPADSLDTATLRLRADLYDDQGSDTAALAAYTALLQRGDTAAGELGRGRVLERLGQRDDAVRAYRSAIAASSDPSVQTFVQARLKVLDPGSVVISTPTSRVFLNFASSADTPLANPIDSSLQRAGLRLERSAGSNYSVKDTSLTGILYFRSADEELARRVQIAVQGALATRGIFQRLVPRLVTLRVAAERRSIRQAGLVQIWLPQLGKGVQQRAPSLPRPTSRPR